MIRKLISVVILASILLTGCVNQYRGIGSVVSDCCIPVFSDYATFSVNVEQSPAFLVPYITDSLSRALTDRKLAEVESGGDLLVVVAYDQSDLVSEVPRDDFEGHLTPGGDFRFDAAIDITITVRATGELIWAARLSRIHNVYVGEYMHKEAATNAIYRSLKDALERPGKIR